MVRRRDSTRHASPWYLINCISCCISIECILLRGPCVTGSKFRALRDSIWYFIVLFQSDASISSGLRGDDSTTPLPESSEAAAKRMYALLSTMHQKFLAAYSCPSQPWSELARTPLQIPKVEMACTSPVSSGGGGSGGSGGGGGGGGGGGSSHGDVLVAAETAEDGIDDNGGW